MFLEGILLFPKIVAMGNVIVNFNCKLILQSVGGGLSQSVCDALLAAPPQLACLQVGGWGSEMTQVLNKLARTCLTAKEQLVVLANQHAVSAQEAEA